MEDKDFINSRITEIEELIENVKIMETETESKKKEKIVDF